MTPLMFSEAERFYLNYWQTLKTYIEVSGSFLNCSKPYCTNFYNFPVGNSKFMISAVASMRKGYIKVGFYFNGSDARKNYLSFKTKYELELRKKFGENIHFQENRGVTSAIYTSKDAEVYNRDLWKEQHEWFRENLEKFSEYFKPKMKEL